MFSNTYNFKTEYAKRTLLGVLISLFFIVLFYYIKNYYMLALRHIGSEALITAALYGRAIALIIFGQISILFNIMLINVIIRIVLSIAVLSFVSGIYLIYNLVVTTIQYFYIKKGHKLGKKNEFCVYLDLQHSYLYNLRLIN